MSTTQPFSILIAALGGEGGGVLVDWLVRCATAAGLPVQATSVPGVAQRTGATSYYIEFVPEPSERAPVFALMPVPGRVDVVLASELLEAARMIERGFVTPQRTLLIAAGHRVLTTLEKMAPADGRFDDEKLHAAAGRCARRYVGFDLRAIAERHGTVISAVLFGALAGAGVLPWSRAACEEAIRAGGIGVDASLAGFAEAYDAASVAEEPRDDARLSFAPRDDEHQAPAPDDDERLPRALHDDERLAPTLRDIVERGVERLTDYQDARYADRYRGRVNALLAAAPASAAHDEAARQLALWMSYEDVIRVADLKTRRERLARVRAEAGAGPNNVVQIREHLKPGLDELAAIAPRRIGERLRARVDRTLPVGTRGRGMTLQTTSIIGFALLRLLASLKGWRPRSLRFAEEDAAIERWLAALRDALPKHAGFALALAELPRLRKGYSDTFERGRAHYERIFETLVQPLLQAAARPGAAVARPSDAAARPSGTAARSSDASARPSDAAAQRLREAIDAALAMPPAAPARERPILWKPRESTAARAAANG